MSLLTTLGPTAISVVKDLITKRAEGKMTDKELDLELSKLSIQEREQGQSIIKDKIMRWTFPILVWVMAFGIFLNHIFMILSVVYPNKEYPIYQPDYWHYVLILVYLGLFFGPRGIVKILESLATLKNIFK